MRLLYDQNLSHRRVRLLADRFPAALHVRDLSMQRADDAAIWLYAREHGLVIVSKDGDFQQRSMREGAPPKVIWVRIGNVVTAEVAGVLRRNAEAIEAFCRDERVSLLILF